MIKRSLSRALLIGTSTVALSVFLLDPAARAQQSVPASLKSGTAKANKTTKAQPTTIRPVHRVMKTPTDEAVTVTGSQARQLVEKTPTAVSSVSGQTLNEQNITTVSGLNGNVPGLNISKTDGFQTNISIRGVGMQTPENGLNTSTGVAFYVDGVYIANSISLDQTLFDVDHLDVFRGPQGTVYGASAPGGALVLNSAQPTFNRVSGHIEGSFGNYNLYRGRAELNVPLSSTFAVRASIQKYGHDGFAHTDSPVIGRYALDDADDISTKVAMKWQPSDNFSATLTGQWYNSNTHGAEQKNMNDPNPNPRVVTQDYPSKLDMHSTFYHLNLDYSLPWATLSSVSSTQHVQQRVAQDSGRLAFQYLNKYDYDAAINGSMNNYQETLALHSNANRRVDWNLGVFVMGQRARQMTDEYGGTTPVDPYSIVVSPATESNPPANTTYGQHTLVNRFSVAPYLQMGYRLTHRLHINGGVRWNYDRYSSFTHNFSASSSSYNSRTTTIKLPTWKAEIDYDIAQDQMVYLSGASGYKPGGVNGNANSLVVPETYKPEKNTTIEIGTKDWFLDHSLFISSAAFFSFYNNMQYIEDDPFPFAYGVGNVPKTDIYGLETEASYYLLHHKLRFDGNLTLEDGSIRSNYSTLDSTVGTKVYATAPACLNGGQYYNPACWAAAAAASTNVKGNKPPGMPTIQGSISASYTWDMKYGRLLSRVQYIYRGPYSARVFDNPALDHVPAYSTVNLFLDFSPKNTKLDISLAATNLTNFAGVNAKFTDPYGSYQTSTQYIAPRQIVGTVAYSF